MRLGNDKDGKDKVGLRIHANPNWSGGPLRYAIVDGLNVRDSRVHSYPPRWNAAPSQDVSASV